MSPSLKEHWNEKYANSPLTQLGWYEARPTPSITLIEKCGVPRHSALIDVGSGASTLIPGLLELGYQNLYAVDISEVALKQAQNALTEAQSACVHWLVEDITQPSTMLQSLQVAVWHDRAVFHFLTEEQHRKTYLDLLQKVLMPGGFAVIATFAPEGATKCSGLPVQRYSAEDLSEFLGPGFKLIESLGYTYQMPAGDLRPYVYTRFQKS